MVGHKGRKRWGMTEKKGMFDPQAPWNEQCRHDNSLSNRAVYQRKAATDGGAVDIPQNTANQLYLASAWRKTRGPPCPRDLQEVRTLHVGCSLGKPEGKVKQHNKRNTISVWTLSVLKDYWPSCMRVRVRGR